MDAGSVSGGEADERRCKPFLLSKAAKTKGGVKDEDEEEDKLMKIRKKMRNGNEQMKRQKEKEKA